MRGSWSREAGAPAAPAAFAIALGIALGVVALPPRPAIAVALIVASLAAVILARTLWIRAAGALLVLVAIGFHGGRARYVVPSRADASLATSLADGPPVELVGRLASTWGGSGSLHRVRVEIESATSRGGPVAFRRDVSLLVAGETDPSTVADVGDRVRVRGPIRIADADRLPPSPLGLPPEPWLSLKSALQIERLDGPRGPLAPVAIAHVSMKRRLTRNLDGGTPAERRTLAVVLALVMGETADLPNETVSAFRGGGVAHVLSISGLHVALIALLFGWLLGRLGLSVAARDATLLVAVGLFAVFAGGRPPVFRAALMIGLYLAARLLGRPTSPGQVVGLSAAILLAARPENLFDVGFLLTYAAVIGLSAFGAPLAERLRGLGLPDVVATAIGATLGAELAVFPIQAYVFNTVPFVAVLSNLVVVPLASALLVAAIVLLPLLLAGPVVAAAAIVPLRLLTDVMLALLGALDRLEAVRFVAAPAFAVALLMSILLAIAATTRIKRVPLAAALAIAAAILLDPGYRPSSGVEVRALDVGQGDSWALAGPASRVLVDGGGSADPLYEMGRLKLLPKLSRLGLISFDAVVLSHPHPDHSRGLLAVLDQLPVGRLVLPRGAARNVFLDEVLTVAARRRIPVVRLAAGERLDAAGLRFDVLHPGAESYPRARENNGSLVLRVALERRSLLLTGDVESLAERDLVARGVDLASDVLKIAHHGSRTSTTPPFLAAVRPRLALIGVGRRNGFGHPSPEVLARLANVRVLRTDRDGDFAVLFLGGVILPLFGPAA